MRAPWQGDGPECMFREIVRSRLTHLLPAILLGLLLPLMVLLSKDYGVTWDERPRQAYGEKVWQFYAGQVQPDEFLTGPTRAHLYGALFDVTAVGLQQVLPLNPYVVRHALNSVFGWLGIVGCYLLAARLGGRSAGLLALVLLAVTPRYWSDAMNNPKDLPFATCATAALVVMAGIPARYPFLTIGRALTLGVSIGLALSVRPGGLLFLAYAVFVVAVQIVRSADYAPRHLLATAGLLLATTAVATTVPLPFWPWLQQRPYVGLVEALAGVSNFEWGGTMIFEGADVSPSRLPWTYVPTWLLYTTPLVTVVGVLLAGPTLVRPSRYRAGAWGLLAAALFPVAYVIVKQSTLYDGIRHLLFIVPPIAALAALGWRAGLESRRPVVRLVAILALLAGVAEPISFSVRNHPNQAVYFNPLLGGPRGAVGRFELDYWGNCIYQAQQRLAATAIRAGMPITVSGGRWRIMMLNRGRMPQLVVTRPEERRHHVEIVLMRGRRQEISDQLGRNDLVDRIETTDGAVLCAVAPGPRYAELADRLHR
jgi:hypothetical protein